MIMLKIEDVKIAFQSVKRTPWRSFITMFGIIVSIVAAISIVGIGEGIKQQVSAQMSHLGKDLITIRPGKVAFNEQSITDSLDVLMHPAGGNLAVQDADIIRKIPEVGTVVPLSIVPGSVQLKNSNQNHNAIPVVATYSELPQVLNQKIAYGEFFQPEDYGKNVAVIGADLAEVLYKTDVPLGETFIFRGQEFIIHGVLAEYEKPPLSQDINFNDAVFIPQQTAEQLERKSAQYYQILVKPKQQSHVNEVAQSITQQLRTAHGNIEDFTVLKPNQNVAITNSILDLLTRLILGIACIALFLGGAGIMNIMWLLVTERTREIGIRKALGATNRQILRQFLAEVIVLSVLGSILGIIGAAFVNILLRIFTDLQPVWPWAMVGISTIAAMGVGVLFGMIPALKAARKEPIESLRNE